VRNIPTLETERLWLRPFRREDFKAFAAMYADPEVARGLGHAPYTSPEAWESFAVLIGEWMLSGNGSWAVEAKETGDFAGHLGFTQPPGWPGLELTVVLARSWWGLGFAEEGARAALHHAFEVLGKERVISLARPENDRHRRLIQRLGGTPGEHVELEGHRFEVYSMPRPGRVPQASALEKTGPRAE